MAHPETLERLVERVVAQVRWRRVEHHALRGLFWGSVAAVAVLLLRAVLGPWAVPAAAALLVLGGLAGAAWGLSRRTPALDAARLADRAFALDDRVATALEWRGREDRTPLVEALVADAVARVQALPARQVVRRLLPREARLLPLPLVAGLALVLAPPVTLPSTGLPGFSSSAEEEEQEQRGATAALEERSRPLMRDRLRPPTFEERDLAARPGSPGAPTAGDLSAIFKDTALAA
ncbi:MAG TPA: hypothetical protein VFX28_23140, partial [Methylomirabilota bacterium]|nr:hypothetical protein [Methylomirabilota bacterium]